MSDLASILANSTNDGPKIESFKFGRNPGSSISGMIIEAPALVQQKDFETKEPVVWPSGDPKMQVVLTIDTGKSNGDDDGLRKLYLSSRKQLEALGRAVAQAGVAEPAVGGEFKMTFTEYGEPTAKGGIPKLYEASYKAPAALVDDGPGW